MNAPPDAFVRPSRTDVDGRGGMVDSFSTALRRELSSIVEQQHPLHLIMRMRRARLIDYSCWNVLFAVAKRMESEQCHLYLCGIRNDYEPIIRQAGVSGALPAERLFPATDSPFEAFERCMTRILHENAGDNRVTAAWRNRLPTKGTSRGR